jgi:methyl-accepting chemotaxis protein
MASLANGDLSYEIGYSQRSDEIGVMASTFQIFRNNLIETERMREEKTHGAAQA